MKKQFTAVHLVAFGQDSLRMRKDSPPCSTRARIHSIPLLGNEEGEIVGSRERLKEICRLGESRKGRKDLKERFCRLVLSLSRGQVLLKI